MQQRFPWAELMQLGIGTYNIAPREFWNCTLRELIFTRGNNGFARLTLNELMKEWPD
jgi:uncharacterized phage protein (TIGR02216 family)